MASMKEFSKPVIVVSKCIEFGSVRWNSEGVSSDFVKRLKHCVTFIPVCPEVEIGLGVPRNPLRIISSEEKLKLIQLDTATDLTEKMLKFAESFLSSLPQLDGFILKSSSPSCALRDAKIYATYHEPAPTARGSGFFAKMVLQKYPRVTAEDEVHLTDPRTAEHFLERVFAAARLRQVKALRAAKPKVKLKS